MKKWLVYILRCRDNTLYTGITNDLENRLQSHNEKCGARYTRARLPVTLVYQENASSRSQASRREAAIKKLTRQKKLNLIEGNETTSWENFYDLNLEGAGHIIAIKKEAWQDIFGFLFASETVAFPLVIVDAKRGSVEFYEKFGFIPFQDIPNKLFITMADIRMSLTDVL